MEDHMANIMEKIVKKGKFRHVVRDSSGKILFAAPIPNVTLPIQTDESGEMIFSTQSMGDWIDEWGKYVKKTLENIRIYRTRKAAGEIVNLPNVIPTITNKEYQYAITTNPEEKAHMQLLELEEGEQLEFKDGKLYFKNLPASSVDLVKMYNNNGISTLDLQTLRYLYGVILQNIQKDIPKMKSEKELMGYSVKIYVPDLMEMLGMKANTSKEMTKAIVDKIKNYHSILGLMESQVYSRTFHSQFPVMIFMGYEEETNTVQFSSPYMNKVIKTVLEASIWLDKDGKAKLNNKGEPIMLPAHSYLIKSSLAKEKNKRAAEIVTIVVTLIEQAGENIPHIKASTIVDRHPDLKRALERATSTANKNNVLKRAFSKAWEFLEKHTKLQEKYLNIEIPNEVPTMGSLDMIFEFPHEGKIKK